MIKMQGNSDAIVFFKTYVMYDLRWSVPIYTRVGYVFDSRFSE